MEESLKVENLSAKNGTFQINVPEFTVVKGKIISLMGRSGSGKSTFLNALCGFIPLTSGRISANGLDLTALPPHERKLAYVFQKGALFPHLTVFENLEFPLRVQGRRKAEREAKVLSWLERLEIGKLRDRRPGEVSGGEAQRTAIGRALITGFPYLLLDEPFSSLDVSLRAEMRSLVKELTPDCGVILVTHDPEDIKALSKNAYRIDGGKMSPKGKTEDILNAF
jgi:ABC-type sugar transport system ATPase subunit